MMIREHLSIREATGQMKDAMVRFAFLPEPADNSSSQEVEAQMEGGSAWPSDTRRAKFLLPWSGGLEGRPSYNQNLRDSSYNGRV
jgi:hypothetical protein